MVKVLQHNTWIDYRFVLKSCVRARSEQGNINHPAYGTWTADFMLRQNESRAFLGKYLNDPRVPSRHKRREMMAIAGIFLIAKWLAKIKQRSDVSCRLCKGAREQRGASTGNLPEETYGYINCAFCDGMAAYLLKLFLLPQRAHTTLFIRCDKPELTRWCLFSLHAGIQIQKTILISDLKNDFYKTLSSRNHSVPFCVLSQRLCCQFLLPFPLVILWCISVQTLPLATTCHTTLLIACDKCELTRWCLCSLHAGMQMCKESLTGKAAVIEKTISVK